MDSLRKMWVIILYTIREALARKVFIFFFAITFLVFAGLALVVILVDAQTLGTAFAQSNQKALITRIANLIEFAIVTPLANLGLLLAIFSSASFVPVMLEKGNIDLLLSKPISRTQLLLGKYFGVLLFVFINIFVLVFGVWLIISLKFQYWNVSFLLVSVVITFTFAVLYTLILLFNILTKSSIPGMMVAYLIFLILSPVLLLYREQLRVSIESGVVKTILDALYFAVPQTSELMGSLLINTAGGKTLINYQPVLVSLLFIILVLIFSIFLFRKKDF